MKARYRNKVKATGLLVCILLGLGMSMAGAQNLVPNPSFEELDSCPTGYGFQPNDRPAHWNKWFRSPEYFNACAGDLHGVDTLVDVPRSGWSYQDPWEGDAYIGFLAYSPSEEFREYAGAELIEPLELGATYRARFRLNLAMGGTYWPAYYACDRVGLLFRMTPNIWQGLTGPIFHIPDHAQLYTTSIVTDTLGWTLVSGDFVADSAYRYIVVGNFFHDDQLDTVSFKTLNNAGAYYLVDSVSVERLTSVGVEEEQAEIPASWRYGEAGFEVRWPGHVFSGRLLDAQGRMVRPIPVVTGQWQLPPGAMADGCYFVLLQEGDRKAAMRVVVVQE